MTSTEDKVRVASRISKELDVRLRQFFATSSSAIPEALELLASTKEGTDVKDDVIIEQPDVIGDAINEQPDVKENKSDVIFDVTNKEFDANMTSAQIAEMRGRIEEYKGQVQGLNAEISRLKTVLMEAPDPVDLVRLKERNDGLNLVIEEKNRSIERLEKEVNRLDLFSHYFKSVEVKQIEASVAEKKKPWWELW
jgi:predicted RNase H-like nuclease (RuvC/YqgF family)